MLTLTRLIGTIDLRLKRHVKKLTVETKKVWQPMVLTASGEQFFLPGFISLMSKADEGDPEEAKATVIQPRRIVDLDGQDKKSTVAHTREVVSPALVKDQPIPAVVSIPSDKATLVVVRKPVLATPVAPVQPESAPGPTSVIPSVDDDKGTVAVTRTGYADRLPFERTPHGNFEITKPRYAGEIVLADSSQFKGQTVSIDMLVIKGQLGSQARITFRFSKMKKSLALVGLGSATAGVLGAVICISVPPTLLCLMLSVGIGFLLGLGVFLFGRGVSVFRAGEAFKKMFENPVGREILAQELADQMMKEGRKTSLFGAVNQLVPLDDLAQGVILLRRSDFGSQEIDGLILRLSADPINKQTAVLAGLMALRGEC